MYCITLIFFFWPESQDESNHKDWMAWRQGAGEAERGLNSSREPTVTISSFCFTRQHVFRVGKNSSAIYSKSDLFSCWWVSSPQIWMEGIDKFIVRKQWLCCLYLYDKHYLIQFTEIVIIIACLLAIAQHSEWSVTTVPLVFSDFSFCSVSLVNIVLLCP